MKPTSSGTCNFLATCFSKFSNFSATLKIKQQLFWQLLDTFIGNFLGNLSFGYLWLSLLLLAPEGLETSSISVWAGITNSNGSVRPFFTRILFAVFLLNKNILRLEDLVVEINNRYPNLKGCSLRSVKRFCSHHGIRKRMPVCDEALDTAVRTAVSEVRGCKLISNPQKKTLILRL